MSETEPDHSDSDDKYDDATDNVLHSEGGTSEEYLEDDDLLSMPDKLLLDAGDSFKSTCDKSKSHYSSLRSSRKEPVYANEKKTDRREIGFVEPVPEQQNVPCKSDLCKYFYVIGNETLIVHSQEPWPKDVKLFQPYEVEQILLPDNANCLAVQAFLKMCNLDFQIEQRPNAEFMSPTGKVPFIKCGAFVVAELEGISSFVAQKGISLTEHLEPEQKSDMRAYQALINNVLGNAENYVCWCDRETYSEVTKPRHGSVYPWPLNLIQTWSKHSKQIKHLKTLGWYDKTLKEVFQEVETCCQALTDRLENNTYFFGNKPSELDALVFGHLFTILTTPLPNSELASTVRKFPALINLVKKIEGDYFKRASEH